MLSFWKLGLRWRKLGLRIFRGLGRSLLRWLQGRLLIRRLLYRLVSGLFRLFRWLSGVESSLDDYFYRLGSVLLLCSSLR